MESYMIHLELTDIDDEFWDLLPAHRKLINDLLIEGTIEMYAISEDRTQGWIIMHAPNDREIRNIIGSFPIKDYFTYEFSVLMVLNNSVSLWPKVNLN